jgi:membrane peptidoglycan carboxypeptidase
LPSPNAYSPINGNAEYAKQRQAYVLKRMVEDRNQYRKAENWQCYDNKPPFPGEAFPPPEASAVRIFCARANSRPFRVFALTFH